MSSSKPRMNTLNSAIRALSRKKWFGRALGGSAVSLLLGAVLSLSGCASGSSGLPKNFPFPPNAGFRITSAALSDGVVGRSYTFYVLLSGGTPPFTCNANLPAGLTMMSAPTVPSGALAGTNACVITGTPTGTGLTPVTINASDGSSPVQVALPTTLNLNIRQEFMITAPPLGTNDGVVGRTYGVSPKASTATTTVSSTAGNAPLTMCTFTGGTGGNTFTDTVNGTSCAFASMGSLAANGSFPLTFSAQDSPIVDPATGLTVVFPAGTNGNAAVMAGATLNVDAALMIAMGLPGAPMQPWDVNTPAAIPPYLNMTPSLTVTSSGGLPAAQTTYSCTSTGFSTLGLTVPASPTSTAPPTCPLSGTPTSTGTNVAVSISINDTGNGAVPAGMVTSSSTLTINAQALVTTMQAAFVAGVSSTDSAGSVAGRTYTVGVSAGTAAAPGSGTLTLTATNLNAGNCAGLTLTTAMSAQPVTSPVTGQPSVSVTAPNTATCSFSVSVTDGIATNTSNFTIQINPPLRVNGPANLPDAVTDRTYNLPAGVVTITGGLPPYTTCTSAGQPAQITGSLSGGTSCILTSTSNPITTAGSPFNLTFTAMDTGDAATAAGSGTNGTAIHLAVDASLTIAMGLATPMAPWTQNAAQPYLNATPSLTVTTTGGLPAAQTTYSCTSTGFGGFGLTVPAAPTTMTPPTCALMGTPTTAGTSVAVSITFHDTGNTAVPTGTATTSSTLTINAQAMLTTTITSPADDGVSSTDSGGFVANRAYSLAVSAGTAGAPGTGNLTLSSTGLNAGNCAGLSLTTAPAMTTVAGTIMGNPSASTTAPATNSCMFSLTVTDTTGTANTTNYTIVIHPPLRLSFAPAAGFGNGAVNRPFSQALTASGGLSPVQSCTAPGLPGTLSPAFAAGTPTCTIQGTPTATFGPTSITVTVMDGTNTATAGAGSATANSNLTINAALMVAPPARIVNGMNGFTYPNASTPVASVTYSTTGGTGGAVTLFANATATGATCTAGSATNFPTGMSFMTLSATTAELQGTPTLPGSTSTLYSFPVCATDGGTASTLPYAVQTASNVMLAIFEPTSYASSETTAQIDRVDTRTRTAASAITLMGTATPSPSGLAVSADGATLYVADVANNTIIPVGTVSGTPGTAVALPPGCGSPVELAATPDPSQNLPNELFATCPGIPEVAVYHIDTPANFAGGFFAEISAPGQTGGIAVQSDNSHVFVCISDTSNQLLIIDNTSGTGTPTAIGATFTLDAATDTPTGIALAPHGGSVYAFIGKAGVDGGNQQGIEVVDVTAAGTAGTPGTITSVADNLLTATVNFNPDDVAVDPTNSFAYVTLPGTNQFAVIDNSTSAPVTHSPFNLPNPTGAANDSPGGVTVPPVPSGNVFAYFTVQSGAAMAVDVLQQNTPPTDPAFTTQLTYSTFLGRIKHIPIPL